MDRLNNRELKVFFAELGIVIELEGNNPLIVNDDNSIYYVSKGHVELFSVPLQEGEITDKRSYLFRANEDQVLFGIHPTDEAQSMGLMITGEFGTQLIKVAKSSLLGKINESGKHGIIEGSIEDWIGLWSNTLRPGPTPTHFTGLEFGDNIEVPANTILQSINTITWLKTEAKEMQWMGETAVGVERNYFPLASGSWLTTGEQLRLSAYSTSDWLKLDKQWNGLSHFHKIIYESLRQKLRNAEVTDWDRLQKKRENEILFMSQAVNQITSVTQGSVLRKKTTMVSTDLLYLASVIVGEAMDLEIKPLSEKIMARSKNPVEDIAKASRIRTRQVVLKGEWWTSDNGPLLAFMEEDGRAVALLQKNPKTYELHDPLHQTQIIVTRKVAQTLKPFAHSFYRPLPAHALSIKDIIKFGTHKSLKRDVLAVIILGLAGGFLGMVTPIATGILFDSIIPEAERNPLVQMTMILIVVAVSILLFEMTRSLAMLRIEGRMDSSIQAAVWDRLLNLPVPFFRDYSAGDLAMRANSINMIRQAISGVAITTIFSGIFSIFNFFLLFYYDVRLASVAFGLVAVSILITSGLSVLQVRYQRSLVAVQGKISGLVLQILNGIAKFRVTGAENRAFFLWAHLFSEQKRIAFKSRTVANSLAVFNSIFPILTSMVLFYIIISSSSTSLSAGKFLAFFAAFSAFLSAMISMSTALISIINIVPLYERAKPILQTLPEVHEAMADPGELSGAVEISHLNFRYKADQPMVLRDVSLQIKPGEFVALIGSSGCGKSTLFRLLLGFEQPNSGSVYYDGQDLKMVDVRSLRSQLGVVLQNGKIMSGDIYSNIIGSSNLTINDAWEAARMAGLDEEIRQMPMGMHTVISEGGCTISGGQRQRILIARAMVRKPRIIYFDEATSALDNRTQAIVSESLDKLQATRVVIAHRLSTIMNADRILVFDKGEIIQTGTYQELINQEGLFADLAKRQLA